MRGGTSKGLYLHEADLPAPGPRRDAVLLRLMGSPDVLQIDGLGGSGPITSKVAIIAPSARDDADVDYTFAQVEIDRPGVGYAGNCDNISSGVGPFAVDEGLVSPVEPVTRVRIFNTNTQALLVAEVPVRDGRARVTGDLALPGVPGTGAEIVMNWVATIGAKTGSLLPTGRVVDEITLENGSTVHATLCDAGNACVWVPAGELGRTCSELAREIDEDPGLLATVREIRGKAAVRMRLAAEWTRVESQSPGLPMVGLVAPPEGYRTLSGGEVLEKETDLRIRDAVGGGAGLDPHRSDAGRVAGQEFTGPPAGRHGVDDGAGNPGRGGQADGARAGDALVQPVHEQQPGPTSCGSSSGPGSPPTSTRARSGSSTPCPGDPPARSCAAR